MPKIEDDILTLEEIKFILEEESERYDRENHYEELEVYGPCNEDD